MYPAGEGSKITNRNLDSESTAVLAFVGDAVHELSVRRYIFEKGVLRTDRMNASAVGYVRAEAQARVYDALISDPEYLAETESSVMRRAKNHRITSMPANISPYVYKKATAFEALLGYLYLDGQSVRLDEILKLSFEVTEKEDIETDRGRNRR